MGNPRAWQYSNKRVSHFSQGSSCCNHIDSATAQKIATRAFSAVQRVAFGLAKRVRFKGKNQLKSVEGKSNKAGIRYNENTGYVEWNSLADEGVTLHSTKLKCIIDVCRRRRQWEVSRSANTGIDASHPDEVVVHGLSDCFVPRNVKYCRIIKRIFNGKTRFFVQLILEGKPFVVEGVALSIAPRVEGVALSIAPRKEKNEAKNNPALERREGIVGLDIGPSTIAYVTDEQAKIERFCDELVVMVGDKPTSKNKQKERRRLQRKLDRQRRANNPQNYNPDGTQKPGKKTWHESTRLKITKRKLAFLQRKLAAHRKTLHGNLANRILKQGKHVKTEKLSYKAFQKNYGRSVRDRAPGKFIEILRSKAENAGGSVDEFSCISTKLSQYCHKCGKYKPKPLSQRVHTCCNLNIQRDLYSAFLAGSVVENKLDTADVINNPPTPRPP